MRPTTPRKHYNKSNNNNNRYRKNNNNGTYRAKHTHHHDGDDNEYVSPAQKRHASNQQAKYLDMSKNARQNGDRVEAEFYLQHADHYTRILNLADEQQASRDEDKSDNRSRHHRDDNEDDSDYEASADNAGDDTTDEEKPRRSTRSRRTPMKDRSDNPQHDNSAEVEPSDRKVAADISAQDTASDNNVLSDKPAIKRRGRPPKAKVDKASAANASDSGASLQAVLPMATPLD